MATNEVFRAGQGKNLSVTCSHPTTPTSGGPCRYGSMVGVAQIAETADGLTTVAIDGVHLLSVAAVNAGGNSAVAAGDRLYYVDADTPPISKKIAGYFVGIAVEAVVSGTSYTGAITSGATATIPVLLTGAGTGVLG